MTTWENELAAARALGHPARVIPTGDLPEHVKALAEAVQQWAEREATLTGRTPHQTVFYTSAGQVMVGPTRVVSPSQLAELASFQPAPEDDLLTGIRTLSDAYWTRGDLPEGTREKIRLWIYAAQRLLHYRVRE